MATPTRGAITFHRGWLVYFLAMIVLVGSSLGYAVSGPWFLLGRWWRPAHDLGGRLLRFAIATLMRLEPWLDGDVNIAPRPGALCVSNHRSHLDAFLLLSRIPNVRMVCKDTLFKVPFLAMMMRAMRQISVRHGDTGSYLRAMEALRGALRARESVHVFPEMTRCPRGLAGTQRFHLAPFQVAYEEKALVVPLVFVGTDDVWPKGVFGLSFRRRIRVETLPALDPACYPSVAILAGEAQRRIESALEAGRTRT